MARHKYCCAPRHPLRNPQIGGKVKHMGASPTPKSLLILVAVAISSLSGCADGLRKGAVAPDFHLTDLFGTRVMLSRCPDSTIIQDMAAEMGVDPEGGNLDVVGQYLLQRAPRREATNCILCGLCVRVC